MAIYPGDIIVGDEDGVVAIPAHLVQVVAREALRVSCYEEFVDLNIEGGRSIFGLFPSSLESLQEYEHWVSSGKPGHSKCCRKQ
ncbi:hypothetical protein D3C84_1191560 [compost metagenome]